MRKKSLIIASAAVLFFIVAPWIVFQICNSIGVSLDDGFGDFVGGVSSWLTQAITVSLLIVIWISERSDGRETAFSDGLLRLVDLYVKERDRLDTARKEGESHYFAWLVANQAPRMAACSSPSDKCALATSILEEQYFWIARWRLSLFRLAMFIDDSKVSDDAKRRAMKIIRASCERDEQRAFFILLHERNETSRTAIQFLKSGFFDYAQLSQNADLAKIKMGTYESWKRLI